MSSKFSWFDFASLPTSSFPSLTESLSAWTAPSFDPTGFSASFQKNANAVTEAQQIMMECFQTICTQQTSVAQKVANDISKAGQKTMSSSTSFETQAKEQTTLAKKAFESAVSNAREISELVTKSNQEAMNVLYSRISDSMDEASQTVVTIAASGLSGIPTPTANAKKSASQASASTASRPAKKATKKKTTAKKTASKGKSKAKSAAKSAAPKQKSADVQSIAAPVMPAKAKPAAASNSSGSATVLTVNAPSSNNN